MQYYQYPDFFSEAKCLHHLIQSQLIKECSIVIGAKNSGKKTFIRFLSGTQLDQQYNEQKEIEELVSHQQFHTTSSKYNCLSVIHTLNHNGHLFFSVPAFSNSQSTLSFFINLYSVYSLLSYLESIQINALLPYQFVLDQSKMVEFIKSWQPFVNLQEPFEGISKATNLILTKIYDQNDKEQYIQGLRNIKNNQNISDHLFYLDALDKNRLYLFYNQDTDGEEGKAILEQLIGNKERAKTKSLDISNGLWEIVQASKHKEKLKEFTTGLIKDLEQQIRRNIEIVGILYIYKYINKTEQHKILGEVSTLSQYLSHHYQINPLQQQISQYQLQDYQQVLKVLKEVYKLLFKQPPVEVISLLSHLLTILPSSQTHFAPLLNISHFLSFFDPMPKDLVTSIANSIKQSLITSLSHFPLPKLLQIDEQLNDQYLFELLIDPQPSCEYEYQGRSYLNNSITSEAEETLRSLEFDHSLPTPNATLLSTLLLSLKATKEREQQLQKLLVIFEKYHEHAYCIIILIELKKHFDLQNYLEVYGLLVDSTYLHKSNIVFEYILPFLHDSLKESRQQTKKYSICKNMLMRVYNYLMAECVHSLSTYIIIQKQYLSLLQNEKELKNSQATKAIRLEINEQKIKEVVQIVRNKQQKSEQSRISIEKVGNKHVEYGQ